MPRPRLPEADVLGRDVVAQALVGRLAERARAGALGEVHARDEPRLDEAGELGRLAARERRFVRGERVEQPAEPRAARPP